MSFILSNSISLEDSSPKVSAAKATPPLKQIPRTDVPCVTGYLRKKNGFRLSKGALYIICKIYIKCWSIN